MDGKNKVMRLEHWFQESLCPAVEYLASIEVEKGKGRKKQEDKRLILTKI